MRDYKTPPSSEEPFELLRLLGTGAFAQTWLARVLDPDLVEEWHTDEVAVKIPLSKAKEAVLRKEVELNGSLYMRLSEVESHHICRYLGFCVFDNKVVMVMEYVSGGSLRKLIGRPGLWHPLPLTVAIAMMHGILAGLAVIHNNQIVHRDIKPENILLKDNEPQISDLGIGRMLRQHEIASTMVGTLYYMAPEMLQGKKESGGPSFYSDIWSVGVTCYEMICGAFPFGIELDTPLAMITQLIIDPAVDLVFPPDLAIPERLQRILRKSLQRDPACRYQNAEDMLQDVEQLALSDEELLERQLVVWQSGTLNPEQIADINAHLPELIEQFPHSGKLYQFIGEFYNKCGQYDKAIEAFQTGIGCSTSPAMLHWGLAMAYVNKKDDLTAVQCLQQALQAGLERSLARYAQIMLDNLQKKLAASQQLPAPPA